jgi:ketosteroid isomerase-like protein
MPGRREALAFLFCAAAASSALAQSGPALRAIPDAAATQEVLDLRERLRTAVKTKDRAALEGFYADNFQHLRDTGRLDLKAERIALLLSGDQGIETAPEEEMTVQVYGPATAVATGTSRVRDTQTGGSATYRWLTVYVRTGEGWRVALSQASRVAQAR